MGCAMAERGALERGHVKVALIRALAEGEKSQAELARLHDVSPTAITRFVQRHTARIEEVRAHLDDEFAGLWAARKANRIGEYQQQVDHIAELMADPEKAARAGVQAAEMLRTAQTALKAIADELGQIPARMQVEHSGQLQVTVNGVDLGALT